MAAGRIVRFLLGLVSGLESVLESVLKLDLEFLHPRCVVVAVRVSVRQG